MESNFKNTNELTYKTETDLDTKNKHGYQMGSTMGMNEAGGWDEHTHTSTCKRENQQGPTV